MDKNQKELELKKLEIEKLKIKEGLFRSLIIVVLTIGAGIGTVLYNSKLELLIKYRVEVDTALLIILGMLLLFITTITYFMWSNTRRKLKEL